MKNIIQKIKIKLKYEEKKLSEKTKDLKIMYDIDYRERNREKIKNYKKTLYEKKKRIRSKL